MGKKTLYHPVSLHVIRGALEYCGFRIGRLKQISADKDWGFAKYEAELVDMPGETRTNSPRELIQALNDCFAYDITCTNVWYTKAGKAMIALRTVFPETRPER